MKLALAASVAVLSTTFGRGALHRASLKPRRMQAGAEINSMAERVWYSTIPQKK